MCAMRRERMKITDLGLRSYTVNVQEMCGINNVMLTVQALMYFKVTPLQWKRVMTIQAPPHTHAILAL